MTSNVHKLRACWFRHHGDCDGRLDRAHWIKQQTIKRQYPHGVMQSEETGEYRAQQRIESFTRDGMTFVPVPLSDVVWDDRVWSWICRKHHFQMDNRVFSPTRADLPVSVCYFAHDHGLDWYLDREYPEASDGPDAA